MEIEPIIVYLAPLEADRFKLFQKHHDLFEQLERTGALEVKFGKCILNFAFGELQNIVKEEIVYKK